MTGSAVGGSVLVRPTVALSPREREVLTTLSTGLSVDEAGVRLGISRSGVRSHLNRLYQRFDTSGLVGTYRAIGWLEPR